MKSTPSRPLLSILGEILLTVVAILLVIFWPVFFYWPELLAGWGPF